MHRDLLVPNATARASRRRTTRRRLIRLIVAASAALILSACGGTPSDVSSTPDLPATTAEAFADHLASLDKPAVVNVWASWCLPCRSEAPLLDQAHAAYGEEIEFIGVDVQDSQEGAKQFLAEFGLDFEHFFDRNRQIPSFYGGIGTPITMFFAPWGHLVNVHNGVIDERTLAINIDELRGLDG